MTTTLQISHMYTCVYRELTIIFSVVEDCTRAQKYILRLARLVCVEWSPCKNNENRMHFRPAHLPLHPSSTWQCMTTEPNRTSSTHSSYTWTPTHTVLGHIPVDNSHSAAFPSRPDERTYLEFLLNLTEVTHSPLWAFLNVLIHRLLTPSQIYSSSHQTYY